MTTTVECPSGLTVQIREFRVSDEDLCTDAKAIKAGTATLTLADAITTSVVEPGPYALKSDNKLDWKRVLQGDLMVILVKNRIVTWGNTLPMKLPCPNCRASVELEVNLEDLPVKDLPESSQEHVRSNKPLLCVLPGCGVQVGFRLLRGEDEKNLAKLAQQQKDRQSSAYLRYRVLSIQDVKESEYGEWLRTMGGRDASYLRAAFEAADCGVDNEVDLECGSCNHEWQEDVKFRADFLFPKYRGKIKTSGP